MSKTQLIIIGAGGHAHSIIDIVESGEHYTLLGMLDTSDVRSDKKFAYQVWGRGHDIEAILSKKTNQSPSELVVAIGDNFYRSQLHKQIARQTPKAEFASLVHPRAHVSKRATIGVGSVVMAGAIVNAGCKIGDGVIINSSAVVDHDCVINDFSSVAPGAVIGGGVSIGERSSIGLGAKLIHNLSIGNDVCVGAGAVVLNSIDTDSVVAYGNPSKVIRSRQPDESYL